MSACNRPSNWIDTDNRMNGRFTPSFERQLHRELLVVNGYQFFSIEKNELRDTLSIRSTMARYQTTDAGSAHQSSTNEGQLCIVCLRPETFQSIVDAFTPELMPEINYHSDTIVQCQYIRDHLQELLDGLVANGYIVIV